MMSSLRLFCITLFLFAGAVLSAVIPSVASSVVPTLVTRSDAAFCASRGNSTAPEPSSNALSDFLGDTNYDQLALNAPIPTGYTVAMSNANCAFSSAKYMLYVQLDSYSPETCAELCNAHEGCDSFNIYVQRDPSQVPGPACPNPAPIAVTKCALYSEPEQVSSCTNFGQHIGPVDGDGKAFKVAIRGSNAYNKLSVKQVIVTVTTTTTATTTETVHHHDRRGSTVFVDPASAEYDATTTVRVPKVTVDPSYITVSPSWIDLEEGTSHNDDYASTTTVTSYVDGPIVATVNVTHPGPTVTITYTGPDTMTTVWINDFVESTTEASVVTVTLPDTATTANVTVYETIPGPIVTDTSTGADATVTVYAKRDIAAVQGKKDADKLFSAWSHLWLPADLTNIVPGSNDVVTRTVMGDDFGGHVNLDSTPDAPTVTVTITRSHRPTGAAEYTVDNDDALIETITLDASYVYTGPTGVPMKTITLS